MKTFRTERNSSKPPLGRQILALLFSFALFFAACPENLPAVQEAAGPLQDPLPAKPAEQATVQDAHAPQYTQQTPEQLQQLVAPIALYPDSLVAQILAGATFPEQVVEADRWVQAHQELKGDALAQAVDQQPWDPSIKALTAFPTVLGNMDKNLSWTSSLGDAYYNQQQDLMDAVQLMRRRAQDSGNLKSTEQQTVKTDNSNIVIEPADPQIVYVPAYDPWVVYGGPILAWPGWYPYPGIWYEGPYLSWGIGFGIGFYAGFGWGWGGWGFDWHNHWATYNHGRYYSQSRTFYNRNNYYRGGGERGGERGAFNGRGADRPGGDRAGGGARPFNGDNRAARGFGDSRGQSGTRSGAFSGYGRGGETRSYSSRGSSSFGGGGSRGGGFGGGGGGGRRH
ncbi:MAG: DUF3300 domain-containing protein [Candidatus Acidiferrum sp.]|jgi:hypothetical protein